MELILAAEAPPLTQWADGSVRVGNTRLLLEVVVNAFRNGDSPEEIAYCYPSISLIEAYAVIAYYLRHKVEVELYLAEVARRSDEIRCEIETRSPPPPGLRAMFLARRAKMEAEVYESSRL